ncbi:MAG: hypothetical protein H6744_20130 [Deltaproteobacteria bacterium]|nr:hypothetical protein [Deltaproteobacteria bacterium]
MRAVGCAVVIIIAIIVAFAMGVGQGKKACLTDCRVKWCAPPELDPDEACNQAELKRCRLACEAESEPTPAR